MMNANDTSLQAINTLVQNYCLGLTAANKVEEDLGLYIPACGTHSPHSTATFDLYETLNTYLEGTRRVLLLLGESGTGKSLFGHEVTQKLAKSYPRSKWIPLFISLPTIKNIKEIMEEHLIKQGFSKESIPVLKQHYQFFIILDAFDEIHLLENLYVSNHLNEWNAKVMFTCRGSYLANVPNYRTFFVPFLNDKGQESLLTEIYLAAFSIQQIENYITQYLKVKGKELNEEITQRNELKKENWLIAKTYLTWIDQIPGLRGLVQTPFLLKITMETLPTIVAQFQDVQTKEERFQMTQVKLYDAFTNKWFGRQEERLMGLNKHPGGTLRNDYKAFSRLLAKKMHERDVKVVTYDNEESMFDENPQPSEWDMFFSDKPISSDKNDPKRTERRILVRKGCPLRKIGESQYAFIHASLLEYFVSEELFRKALRDAEAAMAAFKPTARTESEEKFFASPVPAVSPQITLSRSNPRAELYITAPTKPLPTVPPKQVASARAIEVKDPSLSTLSASSSFSSASSSLPSSSSQGKREKTGSTSSSAANSSFKSANSAISQQSEFRINDGVVPINIRISSSEFKEGKKIGKGAFGIVFAGTYNGAPAAIKKLLNQELTTSVQSEFEQEALIMARLKHPNIVPLYGICLEPNNYAMVMEYMENGNLYNYLRDPASEQWPMRYRIATEIAIGLNYLHIKGVIHGDLKSPNILLDENFHAKISDFGIAKIKDPSDSSQSTKVGSSAGGSLLWMAPELFGENNRNTYKSDVYSFSIILWEISARDTPYRSIKPEAISYQIVCNNKREKIPEQTPPAMAKLIGRCWDTRAETRPDMAEAAKVLQEEFDVSFKNNFSRK